MAELFASAARNIKGFSQAMHPDETVDQTFVRFVAMWSKLHGLSEIVESFLILFLIYEDISSKNNGLNVVGT